MQSQHPSLSDVEQRHLRFHLLGLQNRSISPSSQKLVRKNEEVLNVFIM